MTLWSERMADLLAAAREAVLYLDCDPCIPPESLASRAHDRCAAHGYRIPCPLGEARRVLVEAIDAAAIRLETT